MSTLDRDGRNFEADFTAAMVLATLGLVPLRASCRPAASPTRPRRQRRRGSIASPRLPTPRGACSWSPPFAPFESAAAARTCPRPPAHRRTGPGRRSCSAGTPHSAPPTSSSLVALGRGVARARPRPASSSGEFARAKGKKRPWRIGSRARGKARHKKKQRGRDDREE